MAGGREVSVLVEGIGFPEGPRWRGDRLWYSDFTRQDLCRVGLDGQVETVAHVPGTPSGLGFLPGGTPVVASMHTKRLLRVVAGRTELHADLGGLGGDFLNDMAVDAEGRCYVGTRTREMRPAAAPLPPASEVDTIVMVGPGGGARIVADGLAAPNGTAIAPDGSYLVVAETYAQRLTRFERAADGSLTRRRTFAEVRGCYPDGICLDESGAVWFGSPYTDEFVRVEDGGRVTDRVPLPGGVACMLGGPGRLTLFLLGVDPTLLPVPDGTTPAGRDGPMPPAPGALPTGGHIWTMPAAVAGAGLP